MPRLPSANNDSPLRISYKSKELYDFYYQQDNSQFDLWYDKPYYGKVDTEGRVVYPKESFLSVVSKDNDDNQVLCLLFVANAFRKLRLHYETLYFDGFLDTNSSFFTSQLQPLRGWKSPTTLYSENQQFLYEKFLEDQLSRLAESPSIKNFDDFVEVLLSYVKDKRTPFTRIGFHATNLLSSYTTGLVLEIFSGDYGNDKEAFEFINDSNFEIFEELCKKYGFRIDRNNPWRIIANVNSERLQPFINELVTTDKNRVVKTEEVFDTFYESLNQSTYYKEFVSYLKIFYATFRQAFARYKQESFSNTGCKSAFYTYKERGPVPLELEDERVLQLFYDFRIAESGLQVSNKRRAFHIKNILSIYKTLKKNRGEKKALHDALDYIQYNLGTIAFREVPLDQNNLTRINNDGTMSPQDQFNKRTGEDNSYLNDISDS